MNIRKNSYAKGFLVGVVTPFVTYAILLMIYDQLDAWNIIDATGFSSSFRERTLLLFAICSNLIPMQIFKKRHQDNSMRGLVLPTMGYCVYWLIKFSSLLF